MPATLIEEMVAVRVAVCRVALRRVDISFTDRNAATVANFAKTWSKLFDQHTIACFFRMGDGWVGP